LWDTLLLWLVCGLQQQLAVLVSCSQSVASWII